MKKKIGVLAMLALAGVMSATIGFGGVGEIDASASAKTTIVLQDSFNSVKYSGAYDSTVWKTYTTGDTVAQGEESNAALKWESNNSGGETVLLTSALRYSSIESFQFDFNIPEHKTTWFGFMMINDDKVDDGLKDGISNSKYVYKAPLLIRSAGLGANTVSATGSLTWNDILGVSTVGGEWITMKVVPNAEDGTAAIYVAEQGEDLPATAQLSIAWNAANKEYSFSEGYIAFGASDKGAGQLLDNVTITADGNTISEDFATVDGQSYTERGHFVKVGSGSAGVTLYDSSALAFTNAKAGDRIMSVEPIKEDKSVVEEIVVLDASFNVKIPAEAPESTEIAFLFNLASQSKDPTTGSYAYVIGKDKGTLKKYDENGLVTLEKSNYNRLSAVTSEDGANIRLKVSKNGAFEVYENGTKKNGAFDPVTGYVGNFGFAALSDLSAVVTVDNVTVTNTSYYVPKTKSVTHNFSNDFFGNEDYEDFYVTSTPEDTLYVKGGKLVMEGCSDGTFFGSAHQYDEFIMDYKLSNIYVGTPDQSVTDKTAVDRWLGLDISRASKSVSSYGSYAMLYFRIVPKEGVTTAALTMYASANSPTAVDANEVTISQVTAIPNSYFTDISYDGTNVQKTDVKDGDALCVRWVSEDGILKLYMKKASEGEFTLYYTIRGLELNGYFALCNTGYMHVELDDFSMANTSPMYVCADNEAPETITKIEEELIYDKGHVDVNWEEELNYLEKLGGCGSSVAALSAGLTLLGAAAFVTFKRKK